MKRRIALAGNPNSGKTTLFNRLTGSNQYVGNWPGVTVEKKEGHLKSDEEVTITDLPGIYSLSPYTLEEVVARNYILDEKPDAIINIIDGTNLERNLYLTDQLRELGVPMIVAVNMMDAVRRNGDKIDTQKLSAFIGCPVYEISALKDEGIDALMKEASAAKLEAPTAHTAYEKEVEEALASIGGVLPADVPASRRRWYAVKLFERDPKVIEQLKLDAATRTKVEAFATVCEDKLGDDSESIVTTARYNAIATIMEQSSKRKGAGKLSRSDRIDRVVTNRWLGIPIFVVVMFLVYFLSVTTVGTWATDWANDGVFGDGWFLGGGGADEYAQVADDYTAAQSSIDVYEARATELGLDPASDTFVQDAAAQGVEAAYDDYDQDTGENTTVTVDAAAYGDAQDVVAQGEPDPTDYGIWIPGIPALVGAGLAAIDCAD